MIDGVDYEMPERLAYELHDLAIYLDVLTAHLETNVLAHAPRQIPDELREGRHRLEEGDIRQRDRPLLDVADRVGELLELGPPRLLEVAGIDALDGNKREIRQSICVQRYLDDPIDEAIEISRVHSSGATQERLGHGGEEAVQASRLGLPQRAKICRLLRVGLESGERLRQAVLVVGVEGRHEPTGGCLHGNHNLRVGHQSFGNVPPQFLETGPYLANRVVIEQAGRPFDGMGVPHEVLDRFVFQGPVGESACSRDQALRALCELIAEDARQFSRVVGQ